MNRYIFTNTDDYYDKLSHEVGILEQLTGINIYAYKINNDFGSGYFRRLKLENGIEIVKADFKLKRDFEYSYETHLSRGFELVYFLSGSALVEDHLLGKSSLIKAGEVHYWKNRDPNQGKMKYFKQDKLKFINVYFNKSFFEQLSFANFKAIKAEILSQDQGQATDKLAIPELIVPLKQIAASSWDYNSMSELLFLQSKAIELVSLFVKHKYLHRKAINKKIINNQLELEKIKAARHIIANNLTDPPNTEELARSVGLNNYKLKLGFKEVYQMTIFSCLRSLRMEKAREFLIKQENENILAIANRVGYMNPSHFAAAFKREYGLNPSVFREKFGFKFNR